MLSSEFGNNLKLSGLYDLRMVDISMDEKNAEKMLSKLENPK